jgi:signal transduction histidine kinase/ligand-binding sensor domain-containing protein
VFAEAPLSFAVSADRANSQVFSGQERRCAGWSCAPGRSVLRITAASLLLGGGLLAGALVPTTRLANLNRQGWVMENGLPQNTVQALAQTADGYLWMGTEVGLVRFDGAGFTTFDDRSKPALPGSDVQCLLAAKDGSLWVGTSDGLARLKDGVVTTFTTANGLPDNSIRAIGQESNGTVTAVTPGGSAAIEVNRAVLVDVQTEYGPSAVPDVQFRVSLPDGRAAQANLTTVVLLKARAVEERWAVGHELPGSRVQSVMADREGSLWIGTNGGLVRYAEGKLEKLPVTDPLASASVLAIFEDHEGNLWVGTESNGLQILRDQRFETLTTREGLPSDNVTTVVQDNAGRLWVGTAGNGVTALRVVTNQQARTYSVRDGLLSDVILSLAPAPNGDLWVGTADGLSRIRGSAVVSFTSADGLPDEFIRSLHADADGSLWIGTRRGLTHWSNAGDLTAPMRTYTTADGLGSNMIGAMVRDTDGDLWIATFNGLSRMHGGKLTTYTTANGLSSNVITALLPRGEHALLAGTQEHGWNAWDGSRFTPIGGQNLANTTVHAILDDGHHHLWFATGTGLARCDCAACTGPRSSTDCAHWLEFGAADGLRSRETAVNSHPSAWRAQNGHLFFATPKGLVEVDPEHFPVNTVPPPVAVERFAVDDAEQALHATGLRIPAGHNHFQIEYAGLSFVAPQKVRYRYMLEGFDHAWTDAGSRRTAYYTNIPPGRYTFRVQAANNDGLWNTRGAALAFQLQPHFYQTIWFYVLLAVGLAGLILLALRLRLLHAEREFRAVLGERNRIAREIHDTLAQGYVGISVQLEVLSELLRHNKADKAAKHLDTVRGYVREGLADARQSIWALRSQDSDEATLPIRMRRLVEGSGGHGLAATFSIYGAYRPLPPGTEAEILRVTQEALHNVKKHAQASTMKVQLEYSRNELSLEVRDDGRGFQANSESPAGHYGLTGMRERAATVGGLLEVSSEPGAGTTVRLKVPAPGRSRSREKASAPATDESVPPHTGMMQDPAIRQDAAIQRDAVVTEDVKEQS